MLRLAVWRPLSGLMPVATNVLFPYRSLADHSLLAETETWVTVSAKNRTCCSGLRISNSIMKMLCPRDLPLDLWTLAWQFEFDGALLSSAIRATFEPRRTAQWRAAPSTPPSGETEWSRPPRHATAGDGDLNGRSRTLATPPLCCAALPRTTIEQNLSSARKQSLRRAFGNCVNTLTPPLW